MIQAERNSKPNSEVCVSRELFIKAYKLMLLARVLDDKLASLYRSGKIYGGCFLGRGQEALSVACGLSLRKGDVFAPMIRDAAGRLAFGETVLDALRTYLGSRLGPMRGREGNVHRGKPKEGLLPMISHLGAMIAVVNGILFARRLKGITDTVGLASIGDGATSTGSFHEALNQAAVEKLPLVVVIANNQYAYSTPNSRQFACRSLADRGIGYGVEAVELDGTDLTACLGGISTAVARARAGAGPQLVVAQLLRLCGHGEHDDASYIPEELKRSHLGRDCLQIAYEQLLKLGWADVQTANAWRAEAIKQVDEAVAIVQREPPPDPAQEDWTAISSRHLIEVFPEPVEPVKTLGVFDLP